MNRIKILLSHTQSKLINVTDGIKIFVLQKYTQLSDVFYIETILKNGLNVDISIVEKPFRSSRTVLRLTWFTIQWLIHLYGGISSFLFWDLDAQYVWITGNYFKGLMLPRHIAITTFVIGPSVSNFIHLLTSIKVIKRDNNLEHLLTPIQEIVQRSRNPAPDGTANDSLGEKLRRVILLARIVLTLDPLISVILALSSFALQSNDYFFTWKLLPAIFWSFLFSQIIIQAFWTQVASMMTIIIISNRIKVLIDQEPNGNIEIVPRPGPSLQWKREENHLKIEMMKNRIENLTMIRKYNQVIKYFLGFSMMALFIVITTMTFTAICLDVPIFFQLVVLFFTPFFALLYAICVIPPSSVRLKIRRSIKQLIQKNSAKKLTYGPDTK